MDNHIGDLHSSIVDREIEIIQELLEGVLVFDRSMSHACDVCAELDCLLSFAEASRMYDYRRPQMVEENIIDITQGRYDPSAIITEYANVATRHPLQEQVVDMFVPNDAYLAGGLGTDSSPTDTEGDGRLTSVLLCTGANACGKVCCLVVSRCILLNYREECVSKTGWISSCIAILE
jgi:DNA mismatch repair protein MSH5